MSTHHHRYGFPRAATYLSIHPISCPSGCHLPIDQTAWYPCDDDKREGIQCHPVKPHCHHASTQLKVTATLPLTIGRLGGDVIPISSYLRILNS
jgi:hypothetical protein